MTEENSYLVRFDDRAGRRRRLPLPGRQRVGRPRPGARGGAHARGVRRPCRAPPSSATAPPKISLSATRRWRPGSCCRSAWTACARGWRRPGRARCNSATASPRRSAAQRELTRRGVAKPSRSRGPAGFMRRVVLRLMRPYTAYQDEVNETVARAISQVEREAERRAGGRAEAAQLEAASVQASLLAELRRQRWLVDRLADEATTGQLVAQQRASDARISDLAGQVDRAAQRHERDRADHRGLRRRPRRRRPGAGRGERLARRS